MSDPAATLTRRRLIRLATGASLALVPAAFRPRGADAARQWCRTDPVVKIGGHTAHVYVSAFVRSPKHARALATGPTEIVITLPANVPGRHVASDHGFGHGYTVTFEESELQTGPRDIIPVRVEVRVPMKNGDVPIRAWFVPTRPRRLEPGGSQGTANAWFAFDAP
jgi:hypothetical protein